MITDLEVGTAHKPILNKWELVINTMLGDGDAYDDLTLQFDAKEKVLAAVNLVDSLLFDTDREDEVTTKYPAVEATLGLEICEWPRCPNSGWFHEVDYTDVFYYDDCGVKHNVKKVTA